VPTAGDVRFVSERTGWLPFAAPSWAFSVHLVLGGSAFFF
jgi:hypothetical protein